MNNTMNEITARLGPSLAKASDALHAFLCTTASPKTNQPTKPEKKKGKQSKAGTFEPLGTPEKDAAPPTGVVTLDLFEKLSSVHLLISFNNPPSDRLEPLSCVVPHLPLRIASDDNTTAFLLVKYPQRKIKDLVASSPTLSSIIRKVSDEDKFRKKFSTYEARRTLCRSFPSLLVDERIVPAYIPIMFGKEVISRNRFPVSVCVNKGAERLEKDLEKALKTIQVSFRGQSTLNVCLGYTSNLTSGTHIVENAIAVLHTILSAENVLERGWVDIESIALEDSTSSARLLLYAHNYQEEVEWLRANPSNAVEQETQPAIETKPSTAKKQKGSRDDPGRSDSEEALPPAKRMKQSTSASSKVAPKAPPPKKEDTSAKSSSKKNDTPAALSKPPKPSVAGKQATPKIATPPSKITKKSK